VNGDVGWPWWVGLIALCVVLIGMALIATRGAGKP
jgi:hypothetical protein